jgi:hypothetical protein
LCGVHMFSESWPGHGRLSLTACVRELSDEARHWFCARYGIRVEMIDPAEQARVAAEFPR